MSNNNQWGMNPQLAEVLDRQLVLARADLPELTGSIDWALRRGELVGLLPGVYTRPRDAGTLLTRARATRVADPACIVTGYSAMALHGWVDADAWPLVRVSSRCLTRREWLEIERRAIPRRLTAVVNQVRVTSRALTVIDLIPELGPVVVHEALRRRVRMGELWDAFNATAHRPGNKLRRSVLEEASSLPWSEAERRAHRALKTAGITGWVGNHRVIRDGEESPVAILDVAFLELKLAIEIDGAEYHANAEAFVLDRARDERLARLGWQVVRFPARRVLDDPEGFAASVAAIVAVRDRTWSVRP